jgi:hypothetical protein
LELSKGGLCDVLAAVERVIETFRSDEAMFMHCCLGLGNMTEFASFVRLFVSFARCVVRLCVL